MNIRTYAKINLSLDVTGIRRDGYHTVEMLMLGIGLYDEMEINISEKGDGNIALFCGRPDIPCDERNTAWKAARLMLDRFTDTARDSRDPDRFSESSAPHVEIKIKKNIPSAAGLAGGSSNAAGVITALNRLLELNLPDKELLDIGAKVGADVPFCIITMLGTPCALAYGIGEKLNPIARSALPEYFILLIKPPADTLTAHIYRQFDSLDPSGIRHPDTKSVIRAVETGNMHMLKESTANVLENVTLAEYPKVRRIKESLQRHYPDLPTLMSGSGPTVYTIFNDRISAEKAFESAVSEFPGCACFIAKAL